MPDYTLNPKYARPAALRNDPKKKVAEQATFVQLLKKFELYFKPKFDVQHVLEERKTLDRKTYDRKKFMELSEFLRNHHPLMLSMPNVPKPRPTLVAEKEQKLMAAAKWYWWRHMVLEHRKHLKAEQQEHLLEQEAALRHQHMVEASGPN